MYKPDLALNNLQELICYKTEPTKSYELAICDERKARNATDTTKRKTPQYLICFYHPFHTTTTSVWR